MNNYIDVYDRKVNSLFSYDEYQLEFEKLYLYNSREEQSNTFLTDNVNKYKNYDKMFNLAKFARMYLEHESKSIYGLVTDLNVTRILYYEFNSFEDLMEAIRQNILTNKKISSSGVENIESVLACNNQEDLLYLLKEDYSDKAMEEDKRVPQQRQELKEFKNRIRGMVRGSFQRGLWKKESHTHEIIGCSFEELKAHLEQTWIDNYGTKYNNEPVHIDHIIPLSTATSQEEVVKLCHWTNLQYLKPEDNLSKHDKLNWELSK